VPAADVLTFSTMALERDLSVSINLVVDIATVTVTV
jgi:hypothetical protein